MSTIHSKSDSAVGGVESGLFRAFNMNVWCVGCRFWVALSTSVAFGLVPYLFLVVTLLSIHMLAL